MQVYQDVFGRVILGDVDEYYEQFTQFICRIGDHNVASFALLTQILEHQQLN